MTLERAVSEAQESETRRQQAGINQAALDGAAREGFGNGLFEDQEEDVPAILEEFFPPAPGCQPSELPEQGDVSTRKTPLRGRLATLSKAAASA